MRGAKKRSSNQDVEDIITTLTGLKPGSSCIYCKGPSGCLATPSMGPLHNWLRERGKDYIFTQRKLKNNKFDVGQYEYIAARRVEAE